MAASGNNRNVQIRISRTRHNPVTAMEIVTNVVFILSLAGVIAVIIKCLLMAIYRPPEEINNYSVHSDSHFHEWTISTMLNKDRPKGDKPCCLPYKFQAVITPLATFDAKQKKIMRVYRDWESRLQVMEQTVFDENGMVHQGYAKTVLNYKHNTAFHITPSDKKCVSWEINSGMLEPCMPEDAEYLGHSYIGFHDEKREFNSFYFRRMDKNRSMEMTIAVTSEGCVPIMEHVKGKIGNRNADSLVFFSNVTSLKDESVFQLPPYCFRAPDDK